jgi:hypothetical protein
MSKRSSCNHVSNKRKSCEQDIFRLSMRTARLFDTEEAKLNSFRNAACTEMNGKIKCGCNA